MPFASWSPVLLPHVQGAIEKPVSFAAPAAPASHLLPALGKAMGLELTVDHRLAHEVLAIRVKGMASSDLLKRIAQVTGGAWQEQQGAYKLTLPPSSETKQRRADAIARGDAIRAQLKWGSDLFAKATGGPASLSTIVVSRLSSETLGGLTPRQRVVFSTNPTPMQLALDPSLLRELDLTTLRKTQVRDPQTNQQTTLSGPIASVIFTLEPGNNREFFTASLTTLNAQGQAIGSERLPTYFSPYQAAPPATLPHADATVDLPKDVDKYVRAARDKVSASNVGTNSFGDDLGDQTQLYWNDDLNRPSAEVVDRRLLDPENVDPLALVAGPSLERLADVEAVNLVAAIPDRAFGPSVLAFGNGPVKVSALETDIRQNWEMDLSIQEGCLMANPRHLWATRAARTDRRALGSVVRTLSKTHNLTLDQQAAFATAQPLMFPGDSLESPFISQVDASWGTRIAASSMNGMRQILRIYGALGSSFPTGRRPFATLPSNVRNAVSDAFFNSPMGPEMFQATTVGSVTTYSSSPLTSQERTIYFGKGIPEDALFEFSRTSVDTFVGLAPSGLRPAIIGTAPSVSLSRTGDAPWRVGTNAPKLPTYVPGKAISVQISISNPQRWNFVRKLSETQFDSTSAAIPFDSLPQEVRNIILQADKTAQQNLANVLQNQPTTSGAAKP